MMNVVIPAGGTIDPAYAARTGTPYRALAPLGAARRPVMQRIVDALRGSGVVGQVVGVAAAAVAESVQGVDLWLPMGGNGPANILRGLAAFRPDTPALVCTSDLPFLTPDAVRAFAESCDDDTDVSIAVVRAAQYWDAFPGAPPSEFVRLRDAGPVTMGGLFRVRPRVLYRSQALLGRAFESRKSQARMAALLGPRLLRQWVTHTLTLNSLLDRAQKVLGCRAEAVLDVPATLAFDIDTADDYSYATARVG